MNKDVSYTENSSRWLSAYRQFIRHSLEALIEREYLENDRIIDQQIDQLINFELQLQNISFALSLNVDLELFNFTTFEPSVCS